MRALLVIDMQNGVCRTKGQTLFRLKDLVTLVNCRIRWFREQGLPIIFIQHQNMNLTRGRLLGNYSQN
ncbi:isochorismatase family protein [Limosilactobacillus oris]|uniref:isochorismatase family protein n=1 Tax=Limosilactobacillus oris TaxID=1632 RepID=UPI0024B34170|nr:isochorismatase family protein [Limosilactobacillus oris]WHO85984.1 isochorismatase family protein [Limosilactobacillus oris]